MNDNQNQLDLLRHIETLAKDMNEKMNKRSGSLVGRYPLTFTLLALFGVVAVSEGIKGILENIVIFKEEPLLLLVTGLFILTILGSLYKKLS
jgi:hypothetical protein